MTIGFSITGEFITNLVRTWFWNENRPTEICIELIANCCDNADETTIQKIFQQIVEGRKKFTGTNIFTLEDDNTNIRPILNKLQKEEYKRKINEIKLDMVGNFRKYVDPFATIKSMHIDALMCNGMPNTFEECRHYFTQEKNFLGKYQEIIWQTHKDDNTCTNTTLINTPTMGGLWLVNRPDLVYEACHGELYQIGKNDFWHNIYELTKNDPNFTDRNERYLFSIKPKPNFEERMKALEKSFENKHPELYPDNDAPKYQSPEWMYYMYQTTKERQYNMYPDNIDCWEGLIAPNGDFYSVDFGSHNIKAYYLCLTYPKKFGKTRAYFEKKRKHPS